MRTGFRLVVYRRVASRHANDADKKKGQRTPPLLPDSRSNQQRAPGMPALIHSSAFILVGGLTQSAPKR